MNDFGQEHQPEKVPNFIGKQVSPDVKPVLKQKFKPYEWTVLIISFHQVEVTFMFMIDF